MKQFSLTFSPPIISSILSFTYRTYNFDFYLQDVSKFRNYLLTVSKTQILTQKLPYNCLHRIFEGPELFLLKVADLQIFTTSRPFQQLHFKSIKSLGALMGRMLIAKKPFQTRKTAPPSVQNKF